MTAKKKKINIYTQYTPICVFIAKAAAFAVAVAVVAVWLLRRVEKNVRRCLFVFLARCGDRDVGRRVDFKSHLAVYVLLNT